MSYWEILQRSLEKSDPEKEASEAYIKMLGKGSTEPVSESSEVTSPISPQELTLELWLAMGKEKGWETPTGNSTGTDTPTISKTDLKSISKANIVDKDGAFFNNLLGKKAPQATYKDYETWAKNASRDEKINKDEQKLAMQLFGWSKSKAKAYRKAANKGEDVSGFLNNISRNYYVKDGKIFEEGLEDWNKNDFNSATYKGTDIEALINQYNEDVMNWRQGDLSYSGGKYKMKGFDKGPNVEFDENNLPDWLKNDTERLRAAQQLSYFNAVKDYNNLDILNKYSNENLAETLGLDVSGYGAYNDEDKLKFRKDATRTLFEHLDRMRNSQDGTFNFDGNVQADAIMKYLINNQSTSLLPWLGKLKWDNEGTYGLILQGQKRKGPYGLLAKEGAVINYIRKHLDGNSIKLNKVGKKKLWWFGENFDADETAMANDEYNFNGNTYYRYSTPTSGVYMFVPKNGGMSYFEEDGGLGVEAGNIKNSLWYDDHDIQSVYDAYIDKNLGILKRKNPITATKNSKKEPEKNPNPGPNKQKEKPEYKAYKSRYSDDYNSRHYYATYKNGGLLNMEKINYFLEGGAMAPKAAPAAAPAKGGQDIQAQVMQLVQAAMSGDELANLAILQIMQAAQQGDQQAAQIAQMIQEVAKLMQGQATAAKNGAKLAYIKSLKSGCPAGTEAKYYKKGGTLCKECVSKSRNTEIYQDKGLFKATNSTSNAVKSAYNNIVNRVNNTIFGELQTQVETSGIDITGLYKKGGCLKKKLCGKKKALEGAKVTEEKCGGKAKKAKCELGAELNKCGGKTKKAACGSKAPKAACGTKANMDKCGGKAKKKCLTGGILTLEALQTAYKSLYA